MGACARSSGQNSGCTPRPPANAIYALNRMVPGFREELAKGQYRLVRGSLKGGVDLEPELLRFMLAGQPLHIVPVAKGRAKGGAGDVVKIILGVALVALAFATGFGVIGTSTLADGSAAGALGLGTLGGVSALAIGFVGFGLIIGGVGNLLSHLPKRPAANASFLLSPPTNIAGQGGARPVIYGDRIRVGSVVISAGYNALQLVAGQYVTQGGFSYPSGQSTLDDGQFGNLPTSRAGQVSGIAIKNPGTGYTHATVSFSVPFGIGGSGAAAMAIIASGEVSDIVLENGGSGYTAAPIVTISGDGTGATAVATVLAD